MSSYKLGDPWENAEALVGSHIRVRLEEKGKGEVAWVEGVLRSLNDEGDFLIDTADGLRSCWPFLEAHTTGPPPPPIIEEF